MPLDPRVSETNSRIADLKMQLAEETSDNYTPKTEYDAKHETDNVIDAFASRVEKEDRVRDAANLEHRISKLKKNFDSEGTEEERETAQEHITEQEQKLSTLKKQITDDKAAESEAEDE